MVHALRHRSRDQYLAAADSMVKKKAAETPMIEISAAKVMFFNEAIPIPHLYPMKKKHPIHIWMLVCVK